MSELVVGQGVSHVDLGLGQQRGSSEYCWIRPYCAESTASHPNSEVKLRQAVLVLGWATTRESTVPYPFLPFLWFVSFCLLSERNNSI